MLFDRIVMLEPTCGGLPASIKWYQENLFSGVKKYSTHQFSGSGLGILI